MNFKSFPKIFNRISSKYIRICLFNDNRHHFPATKKNSLKRCNGCQNLLILRFCGFPGCKLIEIGLKCGKGRSKSLISQSLNNSIASSELNRALLSLRSAIESSGIEGAI
jgi:hypothetical protein